MTTMGIEWGCGGHPKHPKSSFAFILKKKTIGVIGILYL